MAYEFLLPDIGEGIAEAEIVRWLVCEGDHVDEDQPVAEVETDKAVVEMPAPATGTVLRLGAKAGAVVRVGDLFVVIDDGGDGDTPAGAAVNDAAVAIGDAHRQGPAAVEAGSDGAPAAAHR
nr:2-oxo acid dehydrogenase subunit E2 [Euzebyales bacterium]